MADFTIYRDKSRIFECDIQIKGAKLSNTKSRMILDFNNGPTLMYNGTIDALGNCRISIPALSSITEAISGNAILEIIAESTVFEPWKSPFSVQQAKSVTVEVRESSKPIVEDKSVSVRVSANADDLLLRESIKEYFSAMPKSRLKKTMKALKNYKVTAEATEWCGRVFDKPNSSYAVLASKVYPHIKKRQKSS